MAVNARIYWDEKNSSKTFFICGAVLEFTLLTIALLIHFHKIDSIAFERPGNPSAERFFGFLFYVFMLSTFTLYLNLIINCIWHRNPKAVEPSDNVPDPVEVDLFQVKDPEPEKADLEPPSLFANAELNEGDPIITRDQIQWKKMFWSTLCAASVVLTFVFLV